MTVLPYLIFTVSCCRQVMSISSPQESLQSDRLAALLGWQVTGLLIPVLTTMLLVSWSVLNLSVNAIGGGGVDFLPATEDEHKSTMEKIGSSIVNALMVVLTIAVVTFLVVLLYKYRCEKFLFAWLILSAWSALFVMTPIWVGFICSHFHIPYDFISALFVLWNFGVVGMLSIFYYSHPVLRQAYLVLVSVVATWSLSVLPEWTAWLLLIFVAIYDIIAVLTPHGPLKLLVETAHERNEPLPGFVYDSSREIKLAPIRSPTNQEEMRLVSSASVARPDNSFLRPFSQASYSTRIHYILSHNPFKLGIGDFVFYSLLCGKAAEFSFFPWLMSLIAVLFGLVGTLVSLVLLRNKVRALPALPISIGCGVVIFFLCRYVVLPFDWFATLSVLAL